MGAPGGCHGSWVAAGELGDGRREGVVYMAHLSQTPEEADLQGYSGDHQSGYGDMGEGRRGGTPQLGLPSSLGES